MEILPQIFDDVRPRERLQLEPTKFNMLSDVLGKIVRQDYLATTQLTLFLLSFAILTAFRTCAASMCGGAKVINQTDLRGGVREIIRRPWGDVS